MRSGLGVLAVTVAAIALLHANAAAQTPARTTGPVIDGYGAVFAVPDPSFPTPSDAPLRVVFDVAETSDSPGTPNPRIETVARFLNMHAQAGVSRAGMDVVLVVHGAAGKDLLADQHYRARNDVDNPNSELLRKLMDAGVRVVLCGQTAASRGLPREELADGVQMALSAMTALVSLQNRGFALIPW